MRANIHGVYKASMFNVLRRYLHGFDFQSPAAMPSNANKARDFGEDCLSAASSAAA